MKLMINKHLFSYKLLILYFYVWEIVNFNLKLYFLKCHITSFVHEMTYNLKCYVLLMKNDLNIVPEINMSRKQMILFSLRKKFPYPPNFGKR